MKKKIAAATVSAALLAGLFAGSVISSPVSAVAQEVTDDATATSSPSRVADVLAGLVADGTITQAQSEAVAEALDEARAGRGFRGHHRGGQRGVGALTEILGLEAGELREALQGGSTIADLAAAAGISTQDVIDALVAQAEERLDDAVADGRIDEATAEDKLAEIEERATDLVNGEIDFSERRGHGPRRGGPPAGAEATDADLGA